MPKINGERLLADLDRADIGLVDADLDPHAAQVLGDHLVQRARLVTPLQAVVAHRHLQAREAAAEAGTDGLAKAGAARPKAAIAARVTMRMGHSSSIRALDRRIAYR